MPFRNLEVDETKVNQGEPLNEKRGVSRRRVIIPKDLPGSR